MGHREPCKKCRKAGYDDNAANCCYCGAHLSTRHEHDHFPVPKRHGGTEVHPVCLNCHDLKDRITPRYWSMTQFAEAITDCPPIMRIFLASMIAQQHDLVADRKELAEKLAEANVESLTARIEELESALAEANKSGAAAPARGAT